MSGEPKRIVIGRIAGLFGVKGWVKLLSWTEPRDKITAYSPWQVQIDGQWREWKMAEGQAHGKGVIARLEGITDRDQAATLIGSDVAVWRSQLPKTRPGEYYWVDLLGLDVQLTDGRMLGKVDGMMPTGANDVMVVKGERERLIPFIHGQVVKNVDLDTRVILVDWDPDF